MRIEVDYLKCSGCRNCEVVCSLHHEGKIWPEASRIRIFMFIPGVEVPHLCFQCKEHYCVKACPPKALTVNQSSGSIITDVSKCNGCGLCIEACPGKAPHLHPQKNHILICNLCDGKPKCVDICSKGGWNALSITYEELTEVKPKTPEELTQDTALKLFGEIAKEVIG